jgi:hypothetical protein
MGSAPCEKLQTTDMPEAAVADIAWRAASVIEGETAS